ncbi:MAG: hypothetical protein GF417_04825, partial [Candidatus Latescibacteria bacterium]|nr:hypothetical protein [bacterium]MBD3423744.1 hypothetical protein [Candidatus Latescibacterota bacterium]
MKYRKFLLKLFMVTGYAAFLSGCAAYRPSPAREIPPECLLVNGSGMAADTITVSLPDEIEPENAPAAVNESERIVFGHLYQTLFAIDCLGEVRPLLARNWSRSEEGRAWSFALKKDTRFWNGDRLDGREVIRSWKRNLTPGLREAAGIDSVVCHDDYTLYVYFDHPCRELPRVLSSPAFSVSGVDYRG